MTASSQLPRRDPAAVIDKVFGVDLREFQRAWLRELFRENGGVRAYTRALWGLPRGNGKSHLAAGVAGYMLLADRPRDGRPAQVVLAAGSWQQAMITFNRLREFITGSPLADQVKVLSGRGFMRIKSGAELFVVSAEGPLQHGLEPTCVVFDEVWNQRKRELYEALIGGMLKRPEPIMVCISSAGYDADSLLWEMCKEGEAGDNPRFFYQWHCAPDDAPYDDPETWAMANPALACERPFLQLTGLEDSLKAMHESEFRRWHLGQWTAAEDAWISAQLWDQCAAKPEFFPAAPTVLGIDASIRRDSTVVCTVQRHDDGTYHAAFRIWQPAGNREIPLEQVVEYVRAECRRYNVVGVAYDPQFLHHAAQRLDDEGIVMVECRQDNARMVPATHTLHEAVVSGKLRHGGDPVARAHALAAGVKETERGLRIKKTASSGTDDAVVALAMAVEWASRKADQRSVYEDRGILVA